MDKLKNTAQPWGDREQMTAKNTDQELWRERDGDFYSNSLSVTEHGGVCINVGGLVICKSLADWHSLAASRLPSNPAQGEGFDSLRNLIQCPSCDHLWHMHVDGECEAIMPLGHAHEGAVCGCKRLPPASESEEHPRADCEGCGHPDCPCNAPEVAQGGQKIAEPAKGQEDLTDKWMRLASGKAVQLDNATETIHLAIEELQIGDPIKSLEILVAWRDKNLSEGQCPRCHSAVRDIRLWVSGLTEPNCQHSWHDGAEPAENVTHQEMPVALVSDQKLAEIIKAAYGWFTVTEVKMALELQAWREWAKKAGVR